MLGKNVGKFRSTKAAHVVFVLVGGDTFLLVSFKCKLQV